MFRPSDQILITALDAVEKNQRWRSRCERCVLSGYLRPSEVILEQVADPKIAYMKIIGLCVEHYKEVVRPWYRDLGWVEI